VMEDAEFRAGEIEIQWLERRLESLARVKPPAATARTAAVVAALIAARDRHTPKKPGNGAAVASAQGPVETAWARAARLDALR